MTRRQRLEERAAQIAAAEVARERDEAQDAIGDSRRDQRGQVRSQHSQADALAQALQQARQQIRGTEGLIPGDRAMALAELSQRGVDVASGETLAISGIRREGRTDRDELQDTLADIAADEGESAAATLAEMLENRRDTRIERRDEQDKLEAERVGDIKDRNQARRGTQRDLASELATAVAEAKSLIEASPYEPTPEEEAGYWAGLIDEVAKAEGVGPDAARLAVLQLRQGRDPSRASGPLDPRRA